MRAGRPRSQGDPLPAARAVETTPYRFAALRVLLIVTYQMLRPPHRLACGLRPCRLPLKGGSDCWNPWLRLGIIYWKILSSGSVLI